MLSSLYYQLIMLLYKFTYEKKNIHHRFFSFPHSVLTGLVFPFLNEKDLGKIDEKFYNQYDEYFSENHNKIIYPWEEKVISDYFKNVKTVLINAVGGGREVYYLHNRGFEVHAYECNDKLRGFGNKFLMEEGISVEIKPLERDKLPDSDIAFDSFIVGWGAYNHMRGKELRIKFLKDAAEKLVQNGLIVLSYWPWSWSHEYGLERIWRISYRMQKLFGGRIIEPGDLLEPMYGHYYYPGEVDEELKAAGFEVIYQNDEDYGVSVGRKI